MKTQGSYGIGINNKQYYSKHYNFEDVPWKTEQITIAQQNGI